MTVFQRGRCCCLAVLFGVFGGSHVSLADYEGQHEFLLFPSIDGFDSVDESDQSVKDSFLRASAGILYSYSGEHFRLLGEYLWSSTESELERLKVGWAVADNATLWLGRFHSPSRFWMSEFHHGQYMQTSITRPSLEQWEDESGPSPSHISGALYEFTQIRSNDSAFEYAMSAGLAPTFAGKGLEPFDFLDPRSGHGLSFNARVAYKPRYFDSNSFGFLGSWNDINVEPATVPGYPDLQSIEQLTAGIFVNWRWGKTRLITSGVYFNNLFKHAASTERDEFGLAYMQPEYEIKDDVTLFGRVDVGVGEDKSAYLRLLPAFVSHRSMAGVRWDFARFNALTLELADTSTQGPATSHLHHKEFRLQWSAVLP